MKTVMLFAAVLLMAVALSMPTEHRHMPLTSLTKGLNPNLVALHRRIHDAALKLGLTADATATIGETFFVKVCNLILPLINEYATTIVIPGESTEHFSFASFKLSEFHINDLSITFKGPNQIALTILGMSIAVPKTHFDVKDKILFIKITCGGDFWVTVTNTNIEVTLDVATVGSHLQATSATSAVQFGTMSVNHEFPGFFCKLGQDIIQLFVGNIDTIIDNIVKEVLPKAIGPIVEKTVNTAFDKIPLQFVGNPEISVSGITVEVNLIPAMSLELATPNQPFAWAIGANRDILLSINGNALDNLLTYLNGQGKFEGNFTTKVNTSIFELLIPAAYNLCPSCPLAITFSFINAPQTQLGSDSIDLVVNKMILGITAVNRTFVPLFALGLNMTLDVLDLSVRGSAGNIIFFQLNMTSFAFNLYQTEVGPIDIAPLSPIVAFLLEDVLIPTFNSGFTGLPLPAIVENVLLSVAAGVLSIGLNVNII